MSAATFAGAKDRHPSHFEIGGDKRISQHLSGRPRPAYLQNLASGNPCRTATKKANGFSGYKSIWRPHPQVLRIYLEPERVKLPCGIFR